MTQIIKIPLQRRSPDGVRGYQQGHAAGFKAGLERALKCRPVAETNTEQEFHTLDLYRMEWERKIKEELEK